MALLIRFCFHKLDSAPENLRFSYIEPTEPMKDMKRFQVKIVSK